MTAIPVPATAAPAAARPAWQSAALRLLLHALSLVIAIGCFFAWLHLKAGDNHKAALVMLIATAVFGFAPLRDILRIFFKVEGKALHLVHVLGALGLIALPVGGLVNGAPLLSHAAMGPFAIMGAAQALMHSQHPRNAQQAAALQHFVAAMPQVASIASAKNFSSPADAQRAIRALTDIVGRAQALGQTELNADPQFRSAFNQVSTRFGTSLGLDAVDLVLNRLAAASPASATQIAALRQQVTQARQSFAAAGSR